MNTIRFKEIKDPKVLIKESKYEESGVRPQDEALSRLLKSISQTKSLSKNKPLVKDGYFTNVIDFGGGVGVAFCTDGVGTKMIVAEMMGRYDTIGIDCVAMNVNDMICVGAKPVSMVDYIACSNLDDRVFEELGKGLLEGARQAEITISGGEIAQLKEAITGIDLIGACIGYMPTGQINTGKNIKPGNLIVGLASSGIHANGLTLARKVLLGESCEEQKKNINKHEPKLGRSFGEELLEPTKIYVKPILQMLDSNIDLKAMVQITSTGFANLNRVENDDIHFVIDSLPKIPEVFNLIQERGPVSNKEMFDVFNMGVGFCVIVDGPKEVEAVKKICEEHQIQSHLIGRVESDEGKRVSIPDRELVLESKKGQN